MPRGPRLDAPGVLHHIMARGIERAVIFRNDADRDDFLDRLERVVAESGLRVHAWALMPNHFHLLAQTGHQPLERAMRSLLTGYANRFNRTYGRVGHLFQNRFKSIVCEKDGYFLELVRYIHLNPVRAGIVGELVALDRYPYTGHAVLVGYMNRAWQDLEILEQFSNDVADARRRYREFVASRLLQGHREDLVGGGLVRSAGGWEAVRRLRRGREQFRSDERILGSTEFAKRLLGDLATPAMVDHRDFDLNDLVEAVCSEVAVDPSTIAGDRGRGTPRVSEARAGLAFIWIDVIGRSGRELAQRLSMGGPAIYRAARRGRRASSRWNQLARRFGEKHR